MSCASSNLARWTRVIAPPVITFITIAAVAELVIRLLKVPAYLLPLPSEVVTTAWNIRGDLAASLLTTASAAVIGFVASIVTGILIAIALSGSQLVRQALYPYTIFFQTVPVVAVAPLLVIWFGAGVQSVAICAFIVSVFPVITNTLAGLLSTDPALKDLFQLYGARPFATLIKLKLPSATPDIVTGMRIAAGLAVIGTIVGEFVAAVLQGNPGLGVMVMEARKLGRTDQVFAAILAASALGLVMFGAVSLAGHLLLRHWHASAKT